MKFYGSDFDRIDRRMKRHDRIFSVLFTFAVIIIAGAFVVQGVIWFEAYKIATSAKTERIIEGLSDKLLKFAEDQNEDSTDLRHPQQLSQD